MTKLNELKAAYEAATPGEWWEDDDGFVDGACPVKEGGQNETHQDSP